jgi:hypothetical protein
MSMKLIQTHYPKSPTEQKPHYQFEEMNECNVPEI